MTDLTYIDCQGLGGAWTLGAVQAGFEVVHRTSLAGGFGDEVVAANRASLPGPWEQDPGGASYEWEPVQAAFLSGTPPCSGFSLLNRSRGKNFRGAASPINECMRELVRYAGRCRGRDGQPGPEVVSIESVQGAFKQGHDLMRTLREILEDTTWQRYDLTHVLMSGASVGAAQMRHRYFWVAHRVPFGVDPPEPRRVATYADAVGDLLGLFTDSWEEQAVAYSPLKTRWLEEQDIIGEVHTNITDSVCIGDAPYYVVAEHVAPGDSKTRVVLEHLEPYWKPGASMADACRAHRAATGALPPEVQRWWNDERDDLRGFNHPARVRPDRPGYVLTGGGVFGFLHWEEPRFLTVRECARLMGYPDAWRFSVARNINQASMWIGKCCPVQSGRWLARWVRRALEDTPGARGEQIGDREYLHQSTLAYKAWL